MDHPIDKISMELIKSLSQCSHNVLSPVFYRPLMSWVASSWGEKGRRKKKKITIVSNQQNKELATLSYSIKMHFACFHTKRVNQLVLSLCNVGSELHVSRSILYVCVPLSLSLSLSFSLSLSLSLSLSRSLSPPSPYYLCSCLSIFVYWLHGHILSLTSDQYAFKF